jgi:hypothetical protein
VLDAGGVPVTVLVGAPVDESVGVAVGSPQLIARRSTPSSYSMWRSSLDRPVSDELCESSMIPDAVHVNGNVAWRPVSVCPG